MFRCLPNVIDTKKTPIFFHLTVVTLGGEAKMESGHTFLRYFFEPFPYSFHPFFPGLSLATRSHDQIPGLSLASHWPIQTNIDIKV